MDLRNNQIKMGEVLSNGKAKALLKKEFPQFSNPLMLSMSKGMTLAEVLQLAEGRVPPERIAMVLRELEDI